MFSYKWWGIFSSQEKSIQVCNESTLRNYYLSDLIFLDGSLTVSKVAVNETGLSLVDTALSSPSKENYLYHRTISSCVVNCI